jgi:hypothetical protein
MRSSCSRSPLLAALAAVLAVGAGPAAAAPAPWDVVLPYPPEVRQAVARRAETTRLLRMGGQTTVYLSFQGETIYPGADSDSTTSRSWIPFEGGCGGRDSATFPPFDDSHWPGHGSRAQVIATLARLVADVYAGYDVRFVTTRPTSGHYTMTVIGGRCDDAATLCQDTGTLGVSPLDCDTENTLNINPDDMNFICSDSVADFGLDLTALAYVIAHEDAHTFGLAHIDRTQDLMFPTISSGLALSWGQGEVTAEGGCSPDGRQDDLIYLGRALGGTGLSADTRTPDLVVVWPPDGATVSCPFDVRVVATDPSGVASVSFAVDDAPVGSLGVAPFVLGLADVTPGSHTLTVWARDWFYNQAPAVALTITVAEPGSPCVVGVDCGAAATGAPCAVPADCASGVCVADSQSYCTEACGADGACPDAFGCQAGLCIVLDVPPGAVGAPCTGAAECRSAQCVDLGDGPHCTEVCPDDGCPNGGACAETDGGARLCGPTPADVAGHYEEVGCSAASRAAGSAALAALALLVALVRRRGRA